MTTRAMLYCQDADALSLDVIAEAAGLPIAETQTDPETGGRYIELQIRRVHVVLDLLVGDELQQQVKQLADYLSTQCELAEPTLPAQLTQVRGALEVAFEPGLDAAGRCERFLRKLATAGRGFLYREGGSLEDADGQKVAWPRPST